MAGIHKMPVRIANREDLDQTACSEDWSPSSKNDVLLKIAIYKLYLEQFLAWSSTGL